jgi:hypothetical protein
LGGLCVALIAAYIRVAVPNKTVSVLLSRSAFVRRLSEIKLFID